MRLRKISSSSMVRTLSIYIAISLVRTAIESSNKRKLSDKYSAQGEWFAGAQSRLEADNRYHPQQIGLCTRGMPRQIGPEFSRWSLM